MSLSRVWKILRKDFALGPRSPFFLYAIVLPVVLTLLFQLVFGSLFESDPRLGIVDEGGSAVTAAIERIDGIDLTLLGDADELTRRVEANDLDAGLILEADFDERLRAGDKPDLRFFLSGESLAADRIILSVTAIDAVREVEGSEAPVIVDIVDLGEAGLPVSVRLVPLIVFYALVMAGLFVPGSSLVEEKEHGTMMAMLVTPVRAGEVLVAKWALGVIFATVMSVATLALNGAIGARPLEVVAVVAVAGVLTSTIGLLVGVVAKDATMFFGIVKGTGFILFMPAAFYLFPSWPQWIAKFFPLYWVIEPIWQVAIMGERIGSVAGELAVALGITAALAALATTLARRMRTRMAAQ